MVHRAASCSTHGAWLQVSQLVPVMVKQVHWLCRLAQQHMPALRTHPHLTPASLAAAEDAIAAAHASLQCFIELCRYKCALVHSTAQHSSAATADLQQCLSSLLSYQAAPNFCSRHFTTPVYADCICSNNVVHLHLSQRCLMLSNMCSACCSDLTGASANSQLMIGMQAAPVPAAREACLSHQAGFLIIGSPLRSLPAALHQTHCGPLLGSLT